MVNFAILFYFVYCNRPWCACIRIFHICRVVDLSSRGSKRIFAVIPDTLKAKACKKDLQFEDVIELMQDYVE